MNKKAPVYVTSPAPLDDGGRRYRVITAAAAVIGAVIGLAFGGLSKFAVVALVGAMLGYLVETTIVKVKWYDLRNMRFGMGHPVEKAVLFQHLIQHLTPLGMTVEMNTDGTPVITYQTMIYEIRLNEDQTFTIWWRKSLARAFFSIDILTIIPNYRKAVAAMGIIAYHIQQICAGRTENQPEEKRPASSQERRCPNCGAVLAEGVKFCSSCGTKLSPIEPAGPSMAGTVQPETVLPAAAPAGPSQSGKKKPPFKIIGIAAGVIIILIIGAAALSGSEDETETLAETETAVSAESGTKQETETGETAGNQQIDMEAYDLYYALEENGVADYVLNAKAADFLKEHGDLFPADSAETVQAAGVIDESLEARQIMKNPDRYGDQLMMLPELNVVQISETEIDAGQYLTEINAIDLNGQQYYIFYNGVLDDVFENDWISAYGLPLGTATFANTEGGETWTIPMAGSYVEKLGEDLSMTDSAGEIVPIAEGEYTNYDSGVWLYVYYYSDDGTLMAQFNVPGETTTYFEVHEIEAEGASHRFEDEYGGTYMFTAADGGLTIYAESESTAVDGFYVMTQDYSNAG